MASTQNISTTEEHTDAEAQMPVLSAQEERRWNYVRHLGRLSLLCLVYRQQLSNSMSHFHEMFKREFNTLYEMADGTFNKRGLSLSDYLAQAHGMKHHLTMHHTIEERFIFPVLAERMPQFKGEHLESHKGIHDGLDRLEVLLSKYGSNPSSYSPTDMKECLDSWRAILFKHLDEEVADLRGENLRKYWTLEEVERIAM